MPLHALPPGVPAEDPIKKDARERAIEQFKRERDRSQSKTMTPAQLREQSIESACGRVVEAMRYGAKYEDVLERVKRAMDEELCRHIHEE